MTSPRETLLCEYRYDPLDRLISHAEPNIPGRQRFYCKSRLTTEIQGASHYSIVQHGDQLLAQQRSESDVRETTLLATDQQRSVLEITKVNHTRQPIAYTPYGHRSINSGLLSLLGFNGERADRVTGCYLLGNGRRAFNPVLLRFNSPDNLSPFGKGGLNSYAYCLGDPINMSDPSGNIPLPKFLARPFNRIGKALGRRRTMTSGPEVTRSYVHEITYKITHKSSDLEADGTWSWLERTARMENGSLKQERYVESAMNLIDRRDERGVSKLSKLDPTLQELAYSRLTPENMKKLPTDMENLIDIAVDKLNYFNAGYEIQHKMITKAGVLRKHAYFAGRGVALEYALQGELMGVHSLKAKIIRENNIK